MEKNLTESELNERIAIIKRLRVLLEEQRSKFQEYLFVLEKQHSEIEQEEIEALSAHTELENQIVANIANLQKVIIPMQALYESATDNYESDSHSQKAILQIQDDLDNLQKKVLLQNEKNRELLQARMGLLKTQIGNIAVTNPYRGRRSVFAGRTTGSVVSVEG